MNKYVIAIASIFNPCAILDAGVMISRPGKQILTNYKRQRDTKSIKDIIVDNYIK